MPSLRRDWRAGDSVMAKIYIAGPMSGIPDHNYPLFHKIADDLRALGHEVINPAELHPADGGLTHPWAYYLTVDLKAMLDCEAVYMLPGWAKSRGASLEHFVATALGLQVTYAEQ